MRNTVIWENFQPNGTFPIFTDSSNNSLKYPTIIYNTFGCKLSGLGDLSVFKLLNF